MNKQIEKHHKTKPLSILSNSPTAWSPEYAIKAMLT